MNTLLYLQKFLSKKIAVLSTLHEIKSDKLPYYIQLAKQSTSRYLIQYALKLEAESY